MNRAFHLGLCAIMVAASAAAADTITRRDGSTLTGKVVAEDADEVTLQSNLGELITRIKVARKDIASIDHAATLQNSPAYARVPIEGEIGGAVRAVYLDKALEQARSLKATHIVLCINSDGGSVEEMRAIIEILKKNDDLKFIAQVKNAGSAAAIIAMTCPTIIIAPEGSIGAAVPYRLSPKGSAENVEAKFLSYFNSIARAAAETGGHSTLLMRGMIEMDLVLSRVQGKKGLQIIEGETPGGTVIKRRGQILTLQGKEALEAGLASAVADSVIASPQLAGVNSWVSVGDAPWSYMKSRQNVVSDARKESETLRAKLASAAAQGAQAKENADKFAEQYKKEVQAVHDVYDRTTSMNRMPSEMVAAIKAAKETRESQLAALKTKYQSLIDAQHRGYDEAVATFNSAVARLKQLEADFAPPKAP